MSVFALLAGFSLLALASPAFATTISTKSEKRAFDDCVAIVRAKVQKADVGSRMIHGNLQEYVVDFPYSDGKTRISCVRKTGLMMTVETDYMFR